ncbi:MAG: hypothetical protein JJE15_13550 [Desulfobacteraceae bacterium]|nr:hypothetical protein [Desulfobacteraceae bacterium]
MSKECCATDGSIMIFACSGGSNVGQLSYQAAVEPAQPDAEAGPASCCS